MTQAFDIAYMRTKLDDSSFSRSGYMILTQKPVTAVGSGAVRISPRYLVSED